ncbi:hypothetical protein SAMN03159293_02762 [Pseudomonas sp. NFACC39-1]|nr:hypothetical protein SAMN03159293_02762 [Pseudomonas sp. NFACC39-1]
MAAKASRAGSLPQGPVANANAAYTRDPVWERACSRKRWISHFLCWMCRRLRGQAHSHRVSVAYVNAAYTRDPVWERACSRKRWMSHLYAGCAGVFAGKPAPTRSGGERKCCIHPRSSVGASLLAKAVGQSLLMLDVPASSRASPLPQGPVANANAAYTRDPVWERACSRKRWVSHSYAGCVGVFAGKPAPTGFRWRTSILRTPMDPVGASLLAMASVRTPHYLS